MPIEYRIDHSKRLVVAHATQVLTDTDVFGYQQEVWSRPDVAGYNELVDVSDVTSILLPSVERMRELASLAASMDPTHGSAKLAIVAPHDQAFGLARMYEVYRGFAAGATKEVNVFRTLKDALDYLK